MNVYYARCMSIYGTPQEKRDLELLRKLGFDVIEISAEEAETGYKTYGMGYFTDIITARADLLAFRALPDGSIPAGVSTEIACAIEMKKPVIELPSGLQRRTLSVELTREYLQNVGQR